MTEAQYFNSDYFVMGEGEIETELPFAIKRLIKDLPHNVSIKDVEFGVGDHYGRDPFEQEPYYLAWVSEKREVSETQIDGLLLRLGMVPPPILEKIEILAKIWESENAE